MNAAKRCPMCTAELVDRFRVVKGAYPKPGRIQTHRVRYRVCLDCKIAVRLQRWPARVTVGFRMNAAREKEWNGRG